MKDRPILMSAPMMRAILAGTKSQTRRVVKPQPHEALAWSSAMSCFRPVHAAPPSQAWRCPYGQPGDRLWVRETWQGPMLEEFEVDADPDWHLASNIHQYQNPAHCAYAADGGQPPEFIDLDDNVQRRWKPSIHMPRWASRITLLITSVRVERLQDISESDAMAEGIERLPDPVIDGGWSGPNRFTLKGMGAGACAGLVSWNAPTATELYQRLWTEINGPDSWAANPWVWAVEFKRVTL